VKIVYVLNSGKTGGMEQHTLDLVTGMVNRGHEVWVLCPEGEMTRKYESVGGLVIIDRAKFDIDPFYIRRLVNFLRNHRIDLIHGHELKAGINALIAGKIAGTPLKIIHVHTPISQWQISPLKKEIDLLVNRFFVNRFADRVIALSESIREARVLEERIVPDKIVVIPNGIDVSRYQTAGSDHLAERTTFVVGYLARLTEEKGHKVLLEGFAEFLKNWRERPINEWPRLVLGGDGPLKESLKEYAREQGVFRSVTFAGFVPDAEKVNFMKQLDVFVFPSLAEGFGLVLLEAMACSRCCLVSDLPVLKEVGGGAVRTFKTGDPKDLSAQLQQLYRDEGLRRELGHKAYQRVADEFTLEKFWEGYDKLYRNL